MIDVVLIDNDIKFAVITRDVIPDMVADSEGSSAVREGW